MTKDYPNERDCGHGNLRGSCVHCELEEAYAEINRLRRMDSVIHPLGARDAYCRVLCMNISNQVRGMINKEIELVTKRIEDLSQ